MGIDTEEPSRAGLGSKLFDALLVLSLAALSIAFAFDRGDPYRFVFGAIVAAVTSVLLWRIGRRSS